MLTQVAPLAGLVGLAHAQAELFHEAVQVLVLGDELQEEGEDATAGAVGQGGVNGKRLRAAAFPKSPMQPHTAALCPRQSRVARTTPCIASCPSCILCMAQHVWPLRLTGNHPQ